MASSPKIYRKLAGKPLSLLFVNRLYQGPDHLLAVESVMAQEHYKRYYYKDIQSIIIQQTGACHVWSVVWATLAALCGLIGAVQDGAAYVSGLLTLVALVFLVINLAKGPSCRVYLQTAVQMQRIKALYRLGKALKTIDVIRSLVESRQGAWRPGELEPQTVRPDPLHQTAARSGAPAVPESGPVSLERYHPLLHRLLFSAWLAAGVCRTAQLWLRAMPLAVLDFFFLVATFILTAMALVRWRKQLRGRWTLKLTWISIAGVVIHGAIKYVWYIIAFIKKPVSAHNHWLLYQNLMQMNMSDTPPALAVNTALAVLSLVLGAWGLLTLPKETLR